MRVLPIASLAVASMLLPAAALAADNDVSTVRVCIATPINRSILNTSMAVAHQRLIYDINQTTQKKKAKVRVEAIEVEGSSLGDAEADSRQKECTYVVVSDFASLDTIPRGLGNPTEMPPLALPNRGTQPRAGLHFRVARVGSSTTLDSGTLGPAAGPDEDTAALDLVYQLAVRVVHAVLKVRPPNVD